MSSVDAVADVEMEVGDGAGAAGTGVGVGSPRMRGGSAGSFVGGALEEDQEGVDVVVGDEEGDDKVEQAKDDCTGLDTAAAALSHGCTKEIVMNIVSSYSLQPTFMSAVSRLITSAVFSLKINTLYIRTL